MKKTVIGCCLTVVGALGYIAVMICGAFNMVSGWSTPPGRLLSSIEANGMNAPLVFSAILFFAGMVILAIEYFKKQ